MAQPGTHDDLASLSNLDEQTLLNELKTRYEKDNIYVSVINQYAIKVDKICTVICG